jgi:hypothetical protein
MNPTGLDPYQPTRAQADKARQQDVAQRIERWQGPIERRAAVLALVLDAADPTAWLRWEASIGNPTITRRVRTDLEALDAETRVQTLRTMVMRSLQAPADDPAALRRDSRPMATTDLSRLRRLALLRLLAAPRLASAPASRPLPQCLDAAALATAAIARLVAPSAPAAWLGHVRHQLQATQVVTPPWPRWRLRALLRVAPLERPRLVAAWVKASRAMGLVADDRSREVLLLAGVVVDSPTPTLR